MLFPVQGTHLLEIAYILIKNSSDKGHGIHFASFLDWSKSPCLRQDSYK